MDRAQVHIVMASYNGEKYIREQLDSVLANTFTDFTIEVCDDGSTDQTKEIVREYIDKYNHISLHENEHNLGYINNFLEGIQRSTSPYVMLCDQDDIWHKDKIEKTLCKMKELEKSQGEDKPLMVFTDAMNFDDKTGEELGSFHKNSHLDTEKVDIPHLFMENKCIGCTIMINHAVVPYLDELPEQIRVHDWWLAMICSTFGAITYLDENTLHYRQHSGNMIGGSSFLDYLKNRIQNLSEQKRSIVMTFRQGEAFCRKFESKINEEQKKKRVYVFGKMEHMNPIAKRYYMIKYGFCKSGFVRNTALFFLI